MKKTFHKIGVLALGIVLISTSCTKMEDFGDTNLNPGATNKPITSALLTNVLAGIGGYASNSGTALYCQYYSETQYPEFSNYASNSATPMGNYSGGLYDLQNIIITNTDDATKATAALQGSNANQIQIARILKAYIYWTMTDRWGDIPYSNALTGDPNVAFDTQESIYKGLITELSDAVTKFDNGAAIKGDIAYGGDVAKWKKLANSMRLLMSLRLSKVYPAASDYAATQFKAALADGAGLITTNADNFALAFPGGNFKNPFYNMYDGRKDYGESETMTTLLTSLGGDARQSVFGATLNGVASTKGVPYGRTRDFLTVWTGSNPDYCYVFAPSYRTPTTSLAIVRAASVLLARAEAADKGWTSESTATLYTSGITASFEQWGIAAPSAGYLANANVVLGAAGSNLKQIAIQQYIAYFGDGTQGWSNWRRTGYPTLLPAPDGTNTPKVIPRRYMYGTTDYSLNADGVAAAVARISGGDKMDSRVWWDK